MLVGAQKAGTTSLLRYLGEHPACLSHPQKEFAYFIDPGEYEKGYPAAAEKYFSAHSSAGGSKWIAKSATLYTHPEAVRKLHAHNPFCKLIFILRNPADRAYSSYLMEMNAGAAFYDINQIEEVIQKGSGWEYELLIDYGFYAKHLQQVYSCFPKNQVRIILFEDLRKDAKKVCQQLFSWLDIDSGFVPHTEIVHNKTQKNRSVSYAVTVNKALHRDSLFRKVFSRVIPGSKAYRFGDFIRKLNKTKDSFPPMDLKTRRVLLDFFRSHNRKLGEMLNTDLSAWEK